MITANARSCANASAANSAGGVATPTVGAALLPAPRRSVRNAANVLSHRRTAAPSVCYTAVDSLVQTSRHPDSDRCPKVSAPSFKVANCNLGRLLDPCYTSPHQLRLRFQIGTLKTITLFHMSVQRLLSQSRRRSSQQTAAQHPIPPLARSASRISLDDRRMTGRNRKRVFGLLRATRSRRSARGRRSRLSTAAALPPLLI